VSRRALLSAVRALSVFGIAARQWRESFEPCANAAAIQAVVAGLAVSVSAPARSPLALLAAMVTAADCDGRLLASLSHPSAFPFMRAVALAVFAAHAMSARASPALFAFDLLDFNVLCGFLFVAVPAVRRAVAPGRQKALNTSTPDS
jgi:hypothetical protein